MATDYHIELFIFPDGMTVEMMAFESAAAAQERARIVPGAVDTCPLCGSDLICPVDWERTSPTTWMVTLRCPNCELTRHVRLDREGVERLNRAAYNGNQTILHEVEELARQFFVEEGEKLVAALRGDLILPMDF